MPAPIEVTATVTTPVVVGADVAAAVQVPVSPARFVWVFAPNPGGFVASRITAVLSGSGVLSATIGVLSNSLSVTLSGSGTLTSLVSESYSRAALLVGAGTLSSTVGVSNDSIPVTLSGSGTLAVAASERYARSAAYSGAGTLSAAVTITADLVSVTAVLSGSGVLSASTAESYARAAALSAGATLSAAVTITSDSIPAVLSGSGVLSASTAESYARTASLAGAGSLTSTVTVNSDSIPAILSGSGTLSAGVSAISAIVAALSGSGTLSSTVGVSNDSISVGLSGSGTLAATAAEQYSQTASLSGSGTLSATVMAPPAIVGTTMITATSVTIPTHRIGDLIIIYANHTGSGTIPSKPSASGTVPAWVTIDTASYSTNPSLITAYFVATATNHTSGTWNNASGLIALVVTGIASTPIGGHAANSANSSTTTSVAPAVTLSNTDGSSLILCFYAHNTTVTSWSTAPTGYTRLGASTAANICCNRKADSTSDGGITQTISASGIGDAGAQIEILQHN